MNILKKTKCTVLHPRLGIGKHTNIITEIFIIPHTFKADSVSVIQTRLWPVPVTHFF